MDNPDVATIKNMHQRAEIFLELVPQHLAVEINHLADGVVGQNGLHLVQFQGSFCTNQPAHQEPGLLPVRLALR